MDDKEFLSYCDTHADTPRCGFVPSQIARLAELAGLDQEIITHWRNMPNQVCDMDRYDIRDLVKEARERLANKEKEQTDARQENLHT